MLLNFLLSNWSTLFFSIRMIYRWLIIPIVIINVVAAENLTLPFKNRMKDVHLKFAVFHVSHSFKQNAFPHFHYYFNHIVFFCVCLWSHRHLTWLLLNLTETALTPAPLQFLWIGLRKNWNSRNVPSTLAYFLFVNHHTIGFFFSSFCWQIFLHVPQPCDKREIWEPHRTFY